MSGHEWKVGDRVRIKPEYADTFPQFDRDTEHEVEEVDHDGDPRIGSSESGWFYKEDALDIFDIV